ncbi:DNA-packaging protein [Adhaeribacter sp. BT258]|uniref:DNA-packaging protein n=1 Tax=Adhaeribacter terrigena TaxID=2793070 RepID=A0ABS1C3A8_9BACT|nr:DNA-packaging protein [Adhaeribacter terrigena]MBK0403885.1 DNA-packaging protein [Adhaeribacter terrigena]
MAANQHHNLKGRPRRFATPEQLWQAASAYFEWCEAHPLFKVQWVGGIAKRVNIEIPRPFTLSGLRLHLRCGVNYLSQLKKRLTDSPQDRELEDIINRIELVIYEQKFVGAAVGIYNVSIIARDLGLMNRKTIKNIEPQKQAVYHLA